MKILTSKLACASFIFLFIVSCGNPGNEFLGRWISAENPTKSIKIEKAGNNFVLQINGEPYPATYSNEALTVSAFTQVTIIVDNEGKLVFPQEGKFMRESESPLANLPGKYAWLMNGNEIAGLEISWNEKQNLAYGIEGEGMGAGGEVEWNKQKNFTFVETQAEDMFSMRDRQIMILELTADVLTGEFRWPGDGTKTIWKRKE